MKTDNAWSAMTGQSISERQRTIARLNANANEAEPVKSRRGSKSSATKAPQIPGKRAPATPGKKGAPAIPGKKGAPVIPGKKGAPAIPGRKSPKTPGKKVPAIPGKKIPAIPGKKKTEATDTSEDDDHPETPTKPAKPAKPMKRPAPPSSTPPIPTSSRTTPLQTLPKAASSRKEANDTSEDDDRPETSSKIPTPPMSPRSRWRNIGNKVKLAVEHEKLRKALIEPAITEIETLVKSNNIGAIDVALVRLEKQHGDNLEDELVLLHDHRSSLVGRADMVTEELSVLLVSDDMSAITAALSKHAELSASSSVVESQWNALMEYREELVKTGRQKLQELLESQDVPSIDAALSQYAAYGEDVEAAAGALRDHRLVIGALNNDSLQRAGKDVSCLLQSSDLLAIDKYLSNDAFPVQLADLHDELQRHRELLVTSGHEKLSLLQESHIMTHIDQALAEFSVHGTIFEAACHQLQAHRQNLVQKQGALEEELSEAMMSDDVVHISSMLTIHEGLLATPSMQMIRTALVRRQEQIVSVARDRLVRACQTTDFVEIDAAVKDTALMTGLEAEMRAAQVHRLSLVESAVSEMSAASQSSDYGLVVAAVAKYDKFPVETKHTWDGLCNHRTQLLMAGRERLQELYESQDVGVIDAALAQYTTYGVELANDVQMLHRIRAHLLSVTLSDFESALEASTLSGVHCLLQRHQNVPVELVPARTALNQELLRLQSSANEVLTAACTSTDIEHLKQMMATYEHDGAQLQSWPLLKDHIAQLCDVAQADLLAVASDPYTNGVSSALQKYAPYAEMAKGIKSLLELLSSKQQAFIEVVNNELTSALNVASLGSEEFFIIQNVLSKHENHPSETDETYKALESHRDTFVRVAQAVFMELCMSYDLEEVETALQHYEAFSGVASTEWQSLQSHKTRLEQFSNDAMEEIFSALDSDDISQATAILAKYVEHREAQEHIDNLQIHRDQLLESMRGRLRRLCYTGSICEIDDALVECDSYVNLVSVEVAVLSERRASEVAAARTEINRVLDSHDFKSICDILAKFRLFSEDLEDGYSQLENYRVQLLQSASHELERARETDQLSTIDQVLLKHQEYENEPEWQALEDCRQNVLATVRATLADLLSSHEVDDIDDALKRHQQYTVGIEAELDALAARRTTICEAASQVIDTVLETGDFVSIAGILSKFDGRPADVTQQHWILLTQRKDDLVLKAREELQVLCNSCEISELEEVDAHPRIAKLSLLYLCPAVLLPPMFVVLRRFTRTVVAAGSARARCLW